MMCARGGRDRPAAGGGITVKYQEGRAWLPLLGVLGLCLAGGLLVVFPPWHTAVLEWLDAHRLAAGVLGCALLALLFWLLPQWQVAEVPPGKERVELALRARHTLAHLVGGMLVLLGLLYAVYALHTLPASPQFTQETLQLAQAGATASRIARAMEHLGDTERLTVRLGGIYALEQLARTSSQDHWPIMEVLMAYVRETTPWPPRQARSSPDAPACQATDRAELPRLVDAGAPPIHRPATDIQAILTVLGRRALAHEKGDNQRVDLSYTVLAGVHLENANLQGSDLTGACLQGAYLAGAHLEHARLEGSDLRGAHLQGAYLQSVHLRRGNLQGANVRAAFLGAADLREANLQGAQLQGVHLPKASLVGADLRGASLWDAELWGADLRGADLRGVKDLAQHQAHMICVDETTQLPAGVPQPPPCRPVQP